MRVLVTGGTGFVGSHTVAAIARAGHDVRLFVRSPERIAPALDPLAVGPVGHVVGDVTDEGAVAKAVEGCDAVVHAAAVFTLDRNRDAEVEATNLAGARNVLEAAHRADLDPILFVSSLSALFPPDAAVFTPDTAVKNPINPYARSKAAAERVARELQADGAPIVITYPGSVWGPYDPHRGEAGRIVTQFVKVGIAPCPPAGGMPVVDARDLGALHAAALERGRGPRRYLAGGHLLNTDALFALFSELTGRRFLSVPTPAGLLRGFGHVVDFFQRAFGIDLLLTHEAMETLTRMVPCDETLSRKELGFVPRPPGETLRDTLLWMFNEGLITPRQVGRLAEHPGRPATT